MDTSHKIDTLCGLFGKSRQAYYQQINYNYNEVVKSEILLQLIAKERKMMPRIGGRKLLYKMHPHLPEDLQIGRDKFFDFLREHGLLVRRRRYRPRTTMSSHWLRKYPNLIREFVATRPNQLWVSDITYVETSQGFAYLFLITDAYSRKIIGWAVSKTLEASNALAERVNGILKDEWINEMKLKSKKDAITQIRRIIEIYNTQRPHSSIEMLTPEQAHIHTGELKRYWKNYWKKPELNLTEKNLCQEKLIE